MSTSTRVRPADLWQIRIGDCRFHYAARDPQMALLTWVRDWGIDGEVDIALTRMPSRESCGRLCTSDGRFGTEPRPLWDVFLETAARMDDCQQVCVVAWP